MIRELAVDVCSFKIAQSTVVIHAGVFGIVLITDARLLGTVATAIARSCNKQYAPQTWAWQMFGRSWFLSSRVSFPVDRWKKFLKAERRRRREKGLSWFSAGAPPPHGKLQPAAFSVLLVITSKKSQPFGKNCDCIWTTLKTPQKWQSLTINKGFSAFLFKYFSFCIC